MHRPNAQQSPIFGFLATLETVEFGYFGGYLVVNALGRPLEFHCTAPVRPSRAHEILYGPTLQPYLLGEQIGGALLHEAKLQPDLVLTDQAAMLTLRKSVDFPLILVPSQSAGDATDQPVVAFPDNISDSSHYRFTTSGYALCLASGYEADESLAAVLLETLARHVELAEPFERIREAIREASRIGERDQEYYGQAAA